MSIRIRDRRQFDQFSMRKRQRRVSDLDGGCFLTTHDAVNGLAAAGGIALIQFEGIRLIGDRHLRLTIKVETQLSQIVLCGIAFKQKQFVVNDLIAQRIDARR
ncbi:hypothetical protein F0238_15770 [Vibrio coralliilyticus]|uniref:Uncharacterized protein n=1 Tax=Vibrio coralliilyticus TaxID=190893 RepID=A0AAP6ZR75_9VIBR|nr:hypothetical protein [Vibrio coralliilyticus]